MTQTTLDKSKLNQNLVKPWIDENDTSVQTSRKKVQAISTRGKRCKVCGVKLAGSYFFTGDHEEFQLPNIFPRMAMHMNCAQKLNEQEKYPILARNTEYKKRTEEGIIVGSWVEFWFYKQMQGKWQVADGGHGKVPSK